MLTVGGWAGLGGQRDPRHAAAGGALPSESGPIFTEQPMRISGMLTGGRETGEGPRTRFKRRDQDEPSPDVALVEVVEGDGQDRRREHLIPC